MCIDGACGTIESHRTALGIQHGRLADILLLTVEGHDVAGCRQPEGQALRGVDIEVLKMGHLFVRQRVGGSVAAVVHDERSLLHLLAQQLGDVRIAEACGRRLSYVGIPVYLPDVKGGMEAAHHRSNGLCVVHVAVRVTVVA